MFVDAVTKEMDLERTRRILTECEWCAKHTATFIKQTNKGNKMKSIEAPAAPVLIGEPVSPTDALLPHLMRLSEWHDRGGVGIHVARRAKSTEYRFLGLRQFSIP